MTIFLSPKGDFTLANQSGVNFQKENILATIEIILEDFQKIFGNRGRSSGNIIFFRKSSKKICVYLGFAALSYYQSSSYFPRYYNKLLILLVMDGNLAEVMKGMSLGEDKSIIILEDDDFCAVERWGRSIMGCLLNPECQNMGRMLKTMPKIWKVYDKVRGLALTKERFQFVFDLEIDIQMVLNQGFWTFDDWGMAME